MDATATAAGAMSLGIRVCERLLSFYDGWKDCDSDISSTYTAITDLSETWALLENTLSRQITEKDEESVSLAKTSVQGCEHALLELDMKLLSLHTYARPEGIWKIAWPSLQESWYPMSKETLSKVKANVNEIQERLTPAMQALQLDVDATSRSALLQLEKQSAAQSASLAHIEAQNQRILHLQQTNGSQHLIGWLSASDPWINHHLARQQHEEETGAWLMQTAQYQKWKLGENKHLWISGKAGCGKTILCSTAIEDVQHYCRHNVDTACAFFYFSFSDKRKQSERDLMKSLVRQLAWREPALSMLRQEHYLRRGRDGLEDPDKLVLASFAPFKRMFLLLDALDECPEEQDTREGVLECIERLTKAAPNLSVLVTSRELPRIRESMLMQKFVPLQAPAPAVDADIRLYVSNQLQRDPRFRELSSATLDLIKHRIASKADGM